MAPSNGRSMYRFSEVIGVEYISSMLGEHEVYLILGHFWRSMFRSRSSTTPDLAAPFAELTSCPPHSYAAIALRDKDKGKDEKRAKKKAASTAAGGKASPDDVGSDTKGPRDGGAGVTDGKAVTAAAAAAAPGAGAAAKGVGGKSDSSKDNEKDEGKGLSSLLGAYESDSDDDDA